MKKILLLASLFLILVLASGCYNGYTGEHVDLYTEAINSVPWVNGYSWGADFKCDPEIEIIDEDQYGRVMFTYYEKYYSGADISFSALIICQGSNEKEVFYYEDENYIVKKQVIYSQNLERFTEEEIEKLKANNDWNKKISYDKCVRKEITRSKPEIPNEEELQEIRKKQSQKKIVIGKGGSMIKRIGQEARKELEELLTTRICRIFEIAVANENEVLMPMTQEQVDELKNIYRELLTLKQE